MFEDERKSATRDTIVAEIAPDQLADAVAQLPEAQALEATLSLAHAEDRVAWIDVVRSCYRENKAIDIGSEVGAVDRSGVDCSAVWRVHDRARRRLLRWDDFRREKHGRQLINGAFYVEIPLHPAKGDNQYIFRQICHSRASKCSLSMYRIGHPRCSR
ncbi:hypothetical protein [Leptolyngbya sp. FACHB-17]|uniref:hypothetical protein n=1 Tax=unclassified Leptolyngbya TaxID=2650499 RepID=UPI0016800432|nr:hypothetical protein [Leptolyngbya sp. FACHB-17]MBD2078955.1 hypothetical protein [Leptolyngbya sp. FACHB-17]